MLNAFISATIYSSNTLMMHKMFIQTKIRPQILILPKGSAFTDLYKAGNKDFLLKYLFAKLLRDWP